MDLIWKLGRKYAKAIHAIDYYDDGEEFVVFLKEGWEQEGYGVDSFVVGEDDGEDSIEYQFSLIKRVA